MTHIQVIPVISFTGIISGWAFTFAVYRQSEPKSMLILRHLVSGRRICEFSTAAQTRAGISCAARKALALYVKGRDEVAVSDRLRELESRDA